MKTIEKEISLEIIEKLAKEQKIKQIQIENAQKLVKSGVLSTDYLKTITPASKTS